MNNQDQWSSFAARIQGIIRAAQFHASLLAIKSSDSYQRNKVLADSFGRLRDDLIAYRESSMETLPPVTQDALQRFMDETSKLAADTRGTAALREERIQALLLMLAAFETEMTFLFSDHEEAIRSRGDRAFEHLQRMIAVDADIRVKWQAAFRQGEVECERLGGVHLLSHGIWAFKANAVGARTDLVYQEAISDFRLVQRAADGLVLTEWKLADDRNATSAFEKARSQAELYSQSALAGFELTRYRYAIALSERRVPVPEDQTIGAATYRHINIAVDPQTPSRGARPGA